jgi:tetratricopeptide (TPR) repeat protein
VTDFQDQLENLVAYCERIGAVPLAVIPPGNDGRYPPCRSILDPETGQDERDAFSRGFKSASALEARDPNRAIAAFRRLLERQPGFAETHFRLASLLELAGNYAEARDHYIKASDLDGLPIRCPAPLRDVFREVAAGHQSLILVDGPHVLRMASRHGIVDDELIQDGQHPTLRGYVALAQDVLVQLSRRGAFSWAGSFTVPTIDAADCAAHFGVDAARWAEVCRRAASFYNRTAHIRHDPNECLALARRYERAAEAIMSGTPPEETGVPGVGVATKTSSPSYVLHDQN